MVYRRVEKERCEVLAEHLIEQRCTVRAAASYFSVSKSTVHKDITSRLREVNPDLYDRVREVLFVNKSERHLRGGEATRIKYLKKKGRVSVSDS